MNAPVFIFFKQMRKSGLAENMNYEFYSVVGEIKESYEDCLKVSGMRP
jgi:hypothetical protein